MTPCAEKRASTHAPGRSRRSHATTETPPLAAVSESLLQPLRDEPDIGVDMDAFITIRTGGELVRRVSGYYQNLSGMSPNLFRTHRKGGPTAPNDERFGVRVLVQPWPDASLGR